MPELGLEIKEQMALAVDRVMTEGSLYDRDLAALAIKQAQGDLVEAIFLLRAYHTTLPRFGYTRPTAEMSVRRRISATIRICRAARFWSELRLHTSPLGLLAGSWRNCPDGGGSRGDR